MVDNKQADNNDILQLDSFGVGNNTITWGNTTLQLSSVSGISTYKYVEKTPFPKASVILIAIGFGLLFMPSWYNLRSLGIIALLLGMGWTGIWSYKNNNPNRTLALYIMMNSGMTYAIGFKSESGLRETVQKITEILDKYNNQTINFNDNIQVFNPNLGTSYTQNFNGYVENVTQTKK